MSATFRNIPQHMDAEALEALPEQLTVREVKLVLEPPGDRTQVIILVTTLLDAERDRKQNLSELYGWRWQAAEVNLEYLKTTLKWSD